MSHKFFGGIHVKHSIPKVPMNQVIVLPASEQVVIPMSMHIGKPCTPIVQVGDEVKVGQKIGEAQGPVSSPVHASVSGKVIAIEPRLINTGAMATSVVIENDGQYTVSETVVPHKEAENDPEKLVEIMREAGLVGMGGATFPTAFKVSGGWGKVTSIIINGAECEPAIASDRHAMLDHPEKLVRGIQLMITASKVNKATLVIEDNKMDAIEAVKEQLPTDGSIELSVVPVHYPQGAEKQQTYTVTGKEIAPGALPSSVGVNVFNVETCMALADAVDTGMPLIQRYVTVTGSAVSKPQVYISRVGTSVYDILSASGLRVQPKKVIMGGPMMGFALFNLEIPMNKGTNGLIAFENDETKAEERGDFIRCGRCASVCPMNLMPTYLHLFTEKNDPVKLDQYHVMDCIECGCCTYMCPARLPLTHSCKLGKTIVRKYQEELKAKAEKEAK